MALLQGLLGKRPLYLVDLELEECEEHPAISGAMELKDKVNTYEKGRAKRWENSLGPDHSV